MDSRYSMVIQWSDEDGAYVVSFPEFPSAHTRRIVRRSGQEWARSSRASVWILRRSAPFLT